MRKGLGNAEQLTLTIQKCVLADGSVVEANVTEDDVATAYYTVAIVFRDSFLKTDYDPALDQTGHSSRTKSRNETECVS